MEFSYPEHGCGAHSSCSPRAKCTQSAQVLHSCPVVSINTGDQVTAEAFRLNKRNIGNLPHTEVIESKFQTRFVKIFLRLDDFMTVNNICSCSM